MRLILRRITMIAVLPALAVSVAPAAPAAAAAPRAAATPGATATPSAQATPSAMATPSAQATVPCPRVKAPAPGAKPSPLPKRDYSAPAVGGPLLGTAGLAIPGDAPKLPRTSAKSWVVADLGTGAVLGACGAHEYGAPASVQKLLLAATVMPKVDPKTVVTVTAKDLDFEPGSSAVGLLKGGKYTVETLWLGLLLNSGNDAARVLARVGGGSEGMAGTMAEMNEQAKHLGALDTHAVTPSGLDGPGQVTSAYDLALIARACFAREDFRRYASTKTAKIPAQPPRDKRGFQIQNDNTLLFEYPGAIGGKTGFTDIARHTYVGAATRNGRTLVVTMLGGEHKPVRLWKQGAALLDWGFAMSGDDPVGRLVEPGETEAAPTATPSPAPAPIGAAAAAGTTSTGGGAFGWVGGGLGAAFVLGWLGLLVLARRRRRRLSSPIRPIASHRPNR